MWEVLKRGPINLAVIKAKKQLCSGCFLKIKIGQLQSELFPVTKGLKEEHCLSSILFKTTTLR